MICIRFYHGRKNPDQEMDGWGKEGPVIGPLSAIIQTYVCHLRLITEHGNDPALQLGYTEDMIELNGMYYGDWEIVTMKHANKFGWEVISPEEFKDTF